MLRQKRRSRGENSIFFGTGIGGWGHDVLDGGGYPLAERGVSPACCCRRTGHSMNMDESSEKGDAAGKTPPPFKPMQAWTMRAVFHWKHWEPALAFSQTIEALASCRHGSDAAVKSLFLHPLMNKTSWTSRLAAFLNTTVAPMPRLMLRSPLEIVPRHWWRSDRGLVQQQISEWVSLKLFCLTCWICPSC